MTDELHRCGIITGSLNCYCLSCDRFLSNNCEAQRHIACSGHWEKLSAIPYSSRFKGHRIRKFNRGYFCELCNQLIPTAVRVDIHVSKDEHKQNRGTHFLKSLSHGVSAFDKIRIDDRAWHGLVDNICCVCDLEIEDEVTHKMNNTHLLNLIQKPIKFGIDDDIYRQINNSLIQCLTCNKLLPLNAMDEHFDTADHVNFNSKCIEESNQEIKDTLKQNTNKIDNNKTDTTALNNDSVTNKNDNSTNFDECEISKILLNAAIYHGIEFNDDTDTVFGRSSEIDDKYDNDYNKQDTDSNNINETDITVLSYSDKNYEHDNSSNIEDFEIFQTKIHAEINRSLEIADETEILFCGNSEIDANHDPGINIKIHIEKHENIEPSASSDIQYPAERVDFNSNCKIEVNNEIQDIHQQDRNSNNIKDTTTLSYSYNKIEHDNSSNIDQFKISKILHDATVYHGINLNDEIKTVFCRSSELDVKDDHASIQKQNIEKHANILLTTSPDEETNFKSKYKMQANHEIQDTIKQDTNINNIIETDTTALNDLGNKIERDILSNIDELELPKTILHTAMFHSIDINDETETVCRSSEMDVKRDHDDIRKHIDKHENIEPSTSTDEQYPAEQMNFNSKYKIEVNQEIKDTLKQDSNSNNIFETNITALNDSSKKIEHDNSSNIKELEISKTMLPPAIIYHTIDINDETETEICRSSEMDVKHDHVVIKTHFKKHDILETSTKTDVQYPEHFKFDANEMLDLTHVHLNIKRKVEENYEIQDSPKQDIKDNDSSKTNTEALDDSSNENEYANLSNIEDFAISKTMLHSLIYQSIDINEETETVFCKACGIEVSLDYDGIKKHIEKHANIGQSTSTDEQYLEHFKFDEYDLKYNSNDDKDNNVKKDVTANSITVDESWPHICKDNDKNLEANDNGSTNPRKFAKDNHLTIDTDMGSALCCVCQVRLPNTLKAMQEHVRGGNHKRSVDAASAKSTAASAHTITTKCGTRLTTQSLVKMIKNLKLVKTLHFGTGYLVNKTYLIPTISYLLIEDNHDDKTLNCLLCGLVFEKEAVALEKHVDSCSFTKGWTLRFVTTGLNEYIREMKPGTFHCGYCHAVVCDWDNMEDHLISNAHESRKTEATFRYWYVKSVLKEGKAKYPPGFKVWNVLKRLQEYIQ